MQLKTGHRSSNLSARACGGSCGVSSLVSEGTRGDTRESSSEGL